MEVRLSTYRIIRMTNENRRLCRAFLKRLTSFDRDGALLYDFIEGAPFRDAYAKGTRKTFDEWVQICIDSECSFIVTNNMDHYMPSLKPS